MIVVFVSGVSVVVVESTGARGADKYRTGLFVVKHVPVNGQRRRPVSPLTQTNNLFGLFGFAAIVPSSKQRPAVASDIYLVALLMHICGATLEAPHRMENSRFGRHPPVLGSRKRELFIPTQIEIIGILVRSRFPIFRPETDFDDGVIGGGLTAASAFCELNPSIINNEIAMAKTARSRKKVRNESKAVQ